MAEIDHFKIVKWMRNSMMMNIFHKGYFLTLVLLHVKEPFIAYCSYESWFI